jgi:molybdopterin synthase sulfur carrier subunit
MSDAIGYFTLLYFASASSFTKKDSEQFQAPLPLPKLFDILEERYPGITDKVLHYCAVTINLNYVDLDIIEGEGSKMRWVEPVLEEAAVIKEGDEVALIPPVSSG